MRLLAAFSLLAAAFPALPAAAHPARIVILRHAEKNDHVALCPTGIARASALATHYLGRAASNQDVLAGAAPAAFYSVTLHTLETLAPSAASWGMPQLTYAMMPDHDLPRDAEDVLLNRATRNAAHAIMSDPSFAGRTVVMAWEHRHIADPRVAARFPDQAVTLRQLLHLDRLPGTATEWRKENFDYFWIIDYADPHSDRPTRFRMLPQRFTGRAAGLPANAWGESDGLPPDRCPGDRDPGP